MPSFKITDYSDIEVMHVIDDGKDSDGWTDPMDIAETLSMPARNVASRLGVMRRLGLIDRQSMASYAKIKLSDRGETVFRARLSSVRQAQVSSAFTNSPVYSISLLSRAQMDNITYSLVKRQIRNNDARRSL
jgi:RIO-like serine/threonine protein kinase